MAELDTAVAAILADPMAHARKAPRAIGFVGDVPADVLAAPGLTAVHLPWRVAEPSERSQQWVEPSFGPHVWAMIEDWADGAYDFMEAVVFGRGDDSAQRLYYYICELQRVGELKGPRPLIWDAAFIPRPSSEAHAARAVRKLAEQLGVDDAGLAEGIVNADHRREWLAAAQASRVGDGARYERLARASLYAPVEDLPLPEAGTAATGRVLLAGSAPADDTLHAAVDATGWAIVAEDHPLSLARLGAPIGDASDPAAAIAAHARAASAAKRGFGDRAAHIVTAAREAKADAVILWLIEEEEALSWHLPAQAAALDAAGIPHLILTRRAWHGRDGAGDTIARFLEGLT
ncbi:2-hydroxyacyl-CoA dehydratase family protein [Sphingomonas sp. Y38-1Y]|uniref:2-hydroxyacyl-CoA dehydratase family protein n=1 Tax=Sphingomonas sp. Y38-1Y TaxID=3078265 RepID=UPI0028E4164D|nr:2-hydroxyacyl-CoA dehydratase family protein [Sphingomonas sp. Y38-1Y]